MITISRDTWADLHTELASLGAHEEIPAMLRHAVEAGIPVWLTDEEGKKLKKVVMVGDKLNIEREE